MANVLNALPNILSIALIVSAMAAPTILLYTIIRLIYNKIKEKKEKKR